MSIDYKTDPRSSIIDALSTMVVNGTQVKIVDSWDLVTNLWQETPASPMMVAAVSPPTLP